VTSADLADAVRSQAGIDLDRRAIELGEPLKELGTFEVAVRLHPNVTVALSVEVISE
jgi:large subunit ribosomal protein L9